MADNYLELAAESTEVAARAELIFDRNDVNAAFDRMAQEITDSLQRHNPLLLCVMIGGLVPTGHLLTRLDFSLQVDYIHASRYLGATSGSQLRWLRHPDTPLKGRQIVIVDDVLDAGITLQAIIEACYNEGAERVHSAVLVEKQLPARPGLAQADFTGLRAPNRYLFGYGMDYRSYLRNGRGIYAVAEP